MNDVQEGDVWEYEVPWLVIIHSAKLETRLPQVTIIFHRRFSLSKLRLGPDIGPTESAF
jgi:hypothetical protein